MTNLYTGPLPSPKARARRKSERREGALDSFLKGKVRAVAPTKERLPCPDIDIDIDSYRSLSLSLVSRDPASEENLRRLLISRMD